MCLQRNDFGDVQDVKEKPNRARSFAATPSAEAERTKETAEDVSSPRAPSTIRERRTASAENGGIKIERTRVGVRATAEREFERANWAVTPPRRHRIQASCGQPKCRMLGNLDRRRKGISRRALTLPFLISHSSES